MEGIYTGIYAIIQAVLGLIGDILKAIYLCFLQVLTRLFYVEREFSSSISLLARLDVIPRSSHHERHRLFKALRLVSKVTNCAKSMILFKNFARQGYDDSQFQKAKCASKW